MVMGILNVTPDSFYAGSRANTDSLIEERVSKMMAEGADMIDIGAYSSRPGAEDVSASEEIARLRLGMTALRRVAPDVPVSVDTFRADVARAAVEEMGADIINDISGGDLDDAMASTVADMRVPYILMHMRGTPSTMQSMTDYADGVTAEVVRDLSCKIDRLRLDGVADIIADPGLGFAKTVEGNIELLRRITELHDLGYPILLGVSKKGTIGHLLGGLGVNQRAEGTIAATCFAVSKNINIVRVNDVLENARAARVMEALIG